jgi:hypothetical protein
MAFEFHPCPTKLPFKLCKDSLVFLYLFMSQRFLGVSYDLGRWDLGYQGLLQFVNSVFQFTDFRSGREVFPKATEHGQEDKGRGY